MRTRNKGRILIVGSIAGLIPGSFQARTDGSKAFLDNFAFALRNESAGNCDYGLLSNARRDGDGILSPC